MQKNFALSLLAAILLLSCGQNNPNNANTESVAIEPFYGEMNQHVADLEQINQGNVNLLLQVRQLNATLDSLQALPNAEAEQLTALRTRLADLQARSTPLTRKMTGLTTQANDLNTRMQQGELQAVTIKDQWSQMQPEIQSTTAALDSLNREIEQVQAAIRNLGANQ